MEFLSSFQRTPRAAESMVRSGVSVQTNTLEAGSFYDMVARGAILPHPSASASGYLSARKSERGRL